MPVGWMVDVICRSDILFLLHVEEMIDNISRTLAIVSFAAMASADHDEHDHASHWLQEPLESMSMSRKSHILRADIYVEHG